MSIYHYEKLARVIFTGLRGELTQKEINSRFQFPANQWHKFESGQKIIMWTDFYEVAIRLRLPLGDYLLKISDNNIKDFSNGGEVIKVLWKSFGNFSSDKIAKDLKLSLSKWNRIINSQQDVELEVFLKLIGDYTSTLPHFLEMICGDKLDPKLQRESVKARDVLKFQADNPFLCVIEALLVSREYQQLPEHSDDFLALKIGVSKSEIKKALTLLMRNGSVVYKDKKYHQVHGRVDMEMNLQDSMALTKYWTQMSALRFERIDEGVPKGWGYRIFPISEESSVEIKKKAHAFLGEVNNIILNDKLEQRNLVQILMLHVFDHTEFPHFISEKKIPKFDK